MYILKTLFFSAFARNKILFKNWSIKSLLFLFLLVIVLTSKAQLNHFEYDQLMWMDDTDPRSNATGVPDKWENESAVILYQTERYEFRKQVMNNVVNEDSYFRQRVILLDQTAVNEYSEFSTDKLNKRSWGRNADYMGIKIIKPDGSFRIINKNDFVEMKQQGATGYGKSTYDKLALPNLEIGDVIDFYFVSIIGHQVDPNGSPRIIFDPTTKLLQSDYPIVAGKLSITPERKTYFNAISLNGAPEPTITKKKKWKVYVYEYGDLEKTSLNQLIYPIREYPCIIYQLIIAPEEDVSSKISFLGHYGELKDSVSNSEVTMFLIKLASYNRLDVNSQNMLKRAVKDIDKMLPDDYIDMDVARISYYYLRHYLNFRTTNYYGYTISMGYLINSFDFVTAYSKILKSYNVKHEIGVCIPRTLGTTETLVIHDQLEPFVKIVDINTYYIAKPEMHSVFGETSVQIEGTQATIINPDDFNPENMTRKEIIPISSYTQNAEIDSIFIEIEKLSPLLINIDEKYSVGGSQKMYQQSIISTYYNSFIDETNYYSEYKLLNKREQNNSIKYLESLEKNKDEYMAYRHDIIHAKTIMSQAVDDVKLDTIILTDIGRWNFSNNLNYEISYSITEGINKANHFYILNIGKLIGKNKEFTDEEVNRKHNIYVDAPHSVRWALILNVPEGYKVEGYENLITQTDNITGNFRSSARVENNKLIVDIIKVYKQVYYPLEQWPMMLEFLNAAVDFTQKQVVLIPT
jgi:hypothetical protein